MNNSIISSPVTFNNSLPVYMNTVCANFKQPELIAPKGRDFHQILLVIDGTGILEHNGKKYELKKGCAFFVGADIPVSYKSTDNLITAFLSVKGTGINELMNYFSCNGFLFRECVNIDKYLSFINDIIFEFYNYKREGIISSIAYSMYINFFEHKFQENDIMKKILQHIEKNYTKKLTLKDISDTFNISVSSLSHKFKERYKCTVFEYILNLRLTYAKNLIQLNTSQKIQNVAYSCGFDDVSYFCKAYKKKYGISPSKSK